MTKRSIAGQVWYRLSQGIGHLLRRSDPAVDATLQALLTPAQWRLLQRLSPSDRLHHLNVHQRLVQVGYTDRDLLLAALLHDTGKVDEQGSVHLLHRTIKVLLIRLAPESLEALSEHDGGWLRHGIYLTLNHAAIGAALAREARASQRTCWLIEHHDDGTIRDDVELQALQAADARE